MEAELKYTITEGAPLQKEAWDDLCRMNGNLVQSTYFDKVQEFYKQIPIYVEVTQNMVFIGGVKFYFWKSQKTNITKYFSSRLTQFGEFIVSQGFFQIVKDKTTKSLSEIFDRKRPVFYSAKSFYGNIDLILFPDKIDPISIDFHNVAFIDLNVPEETLWGNLHSKNRNSIRKAWKEDGTVIFNSNDFLMFSDLIQKTYSENKNKIPNILFLEKIWNELSKAKIAKLYFAGNNEEMFSGALLYEFGLCSYYAFGGGKKDSRGYGNLLHWELIKHLKSKGLKYYYLGETAKKIDEKNIKFSKGITNFKRKFGVLERPAIKVEFNLAPKKARIWELALISYRILTKLKWEK